MKPHCKKDGGSNYSNHVIRCIAIAGAVFLVILLKACASVAGSGDFDSWHYHPNTGDPAIGSGPWRL